jgi:hypothetical protein
MGGGDLTTKLRITYLAGMLWRFSFATRGRTAVVETGCPQSPEVQAFLLGLDPAHYPLGRMTCDLRRLRLHGLIQRVSRRHRYQVTAPGRRIARWFTRTHARRLRPKLAAGSGSHSSRR